MAEEKPTPSTVFARQMKDVRERRQWSQQKLADRLTELGHPKNQTTIARIEADKLKISLDDAFAIAAALEVGSATNSPLILRVIYSLHWGG